MIARIVLLAAGAVLVGLGVWLYTPDKPRAALVAAYAGPPSSFVDLGGLTLHVRDTGPHDAPVLLLLHGFGSNLHTWDDWAARLDHEFRVVRLDLPGFGLTGPDPGGYADQRSIEVLLALMDRLGIARATLVGNSLGGRIAWMFAAFHPERTDKLVLLAPDGFASAEFAYGEAPELPLMLRALPYVLPMALLRPMLRTAYANPAVLTDARANLYRDMMLAPGVRHAILERLKQTILIEPEPLLRRITAPTLLLWGAKDAMIPVANAEAYAAVIPHTWRVTLDGVGHLPQEEAPDISARAVRDFVMQQP